MDHPLRCLATSLGLAAALAAQPSLAGPRIFPRGARTPGRVDTRFDAGTSAWLFTLRDLSGAALVEYRVPIQHPNMQKGMLRVEETTTGIVPVNGGLMYRTSLPGPAVDLGAALTPLELAYSPPLTLASTLLSSSLTNDVLSLRYRDSLAAGGATYVTEKTYTLRLVGKSLEIVVAGDENVRSAAAYNYCGFMFGSGENLVAPNRAQRIPFMDTVPVFVGHNGGAPVFCTRMVDWYLSNASDPFLNHAPSVNGTSFVGESPPGYYHNSAGELNAPLRETAYIIVSRDINDTFVVVDRPPSEYRQLYASRANSLFPHGSSYAAGKAWSDTAMSLGIDEMQQQHYGWMKTPTNVNGPDYTPAPPAVPVGTFFGTEAQWLAYAASLAAGNWGLTPYFEGSQMDQGYVLPGAPPLTLMLNGYPNPYLLGANPLYDDAKCVRDAESKFQLGWNTTNNLVDTNLRYLGHNARVLAPHLRATVMGAQAARLHDATGWPTGGVHLDADTNVPGWVRIDQDRQTGFDRTIAESARSREVYFRTMKDAMTGPLLTERAAYRVNAFDDLMAGLMDGTQGGIPMDWSPGTSGPPISCATAEVIPDYAWGEVATKATGLYGMGYEDAFGLPLAQPGWHAPVTDEWHATLLSHGHTAHFTVSPDNPSDVWDWRGIVHSYYLVHGIGKAMRSYRMTQVRYEHPGTGVELDLAGAIAAGLDLTAPRLIVRFDHGPDTLEFKANHGAADWPTSVLGQTYTIPQNGFVGAGTNGLRALSALNPSSSARVDYSFEPGFAEMIDLRGVVQSYNGFPGTLYPSPISPPPGPGLVIVRDLRNNAVYYAAGRQTVGVASQPPVPVGLRIDPDDTTRLSPGRTRLGLRATLLHAGPNGAERDVTGIVKWTSSNPAIATVNRMGAIAAVPAGSVPVTVGSTTIQAVDLATGLSATVTISAQARPVVSSPVVTAVTSTGAFASCTTDSACASVVLSVLPVGSTTPTTVTGRPDPAQKTHVFDLGTLVTLTQYQISATAINGLGLRTTTPAVVFTTP